MFKILASAKFLFICFMLLLAAVPHQALAFSAEKLPVKQSSQLWNVELGPGKAQYSKRQQPKGTDFTVYSLDIRSKTEAASDMQHVQIEAFTNQPDSNTQYEIFTKSAHKDVKNHRLYMHQHIFPVPKESEEVEVTITWSKKGEHKRYKETFIFNSK